MSPSTSLADAITAAENANAAYQAASTTTTNDAAAVEVIQTKLDAANAQVANDKTAQNAAASTFNAALDNLIAVATSAKIPTA